MTRALELNLWIWNDSGIFCLAVGMGIDLHVCHSGSEWNWSLMVKFYNFIQFHIWAGLCTPANFSCTCVIYGSKAKYTSELERPIMDEKLKLMLKYICQLFPAWNCLGLDTLFYVEYIWICVDFWTEFGIILESDTEVGNCT